MSTEYSRDLDLDKAIGTILLLAYKLNKRATIVMADELAARWRNATSA